MESETCNIFLTCRVPGSKEISLEYENVKVFTTAGSHIILEDGYKQVGWYPCEYTVIQIN